MSLVSSDDSQAADIYGYEDPDVVAEQNRLKREEYNHVDVWSSFRSDDGGDRHPRRQRQQQQRAPRRSSMKHESPDGTQSRSTRRGSISAVGIIEVRLPGHSDVILRRTSIDFVEPVQMDSWVPKVTKKVQAAIERYHHYEHDDEDEDCPHHSTTTEVLAGSDENILHSNWMASEDYDKIAHDNRKIIRAVVRGTDKNFCTRGLESQLDQHGTVERSRNDARQAVWDEQRRQKSAGIFDEAQIMEKYRLAGVQSTLSAVERAEQDAADVENYLKTTRRMMRRLSC